MSTNPLASDKNEYSLLKEEDTSLNNLFNMWCSYFSGLLAILQMVYGIGLVLFFFFLFDVNYEKWEIPLSMVLTMVFTGFIVQTSALLIIVGHIKRNSQYVYMGCIFPVFPRVLSHLLYRVQKMLSRFYFFVFDRLICYHLLKIYSAQFKIRFMNLGYVNDNDGAVNNAIRENGVEESEAPHIGLYEKTLSHHPQYPSLNGCRLLEIGCGQGGGIDWINRSHPSLTSVTGMDRVAIRDSIVTGDAHDLPFKPSSFDIVINIESSHLYRNPQLFFDECSRVLSKGGHLCWTDLRFDGDEKQVLNQAEKAGFKLVSIEEITDSVIRGMEKVAQRYDQILLTAPWYIKLFGATFRKTYFAPATEAYERYVKREKRYWTACWVKK